MPGLARREIVHEGETGIYHCVLRCVRRAFLCGVDPYRSTDYSHRNDLAQLSLRLLAGRHSPNPSFGWVRGMSERNCVRGVVGSWEQAAL